jgi:SHOCT-like domain
MTNAEERMKILKMIEDGKISAEDGAKLLAALSEGRRSGAGNANRSAAAGRWLRIRVTDIATGRSKAAVQIPLGLIDAGMKIGAHFAPEVEGVDMSSVMDALRAGVTGKIIDVIDDEDGEHVEIYVE